MGDYSARYALFLPKKGDLGQRTNWLNIERFANRSGLLSFLAPSTTLPIYTTAPPATTGGYPTVEAPSAILANPLEAKIFIQAESLNRIPNAGGDTIVTFPVMFPNGVITVTITGLDAGQVLRPTFSVYPDFSDRSRFTFHTHNEATGAAHATTLRFGYVAVGF